MEPVIIKIDKKPFMVGDVFVDTVKVTELYFEKLIEATQRSRSGVKENNEILRNLQREKLRRQCEFFDKAGKRIEVTDIAMTQMPAVYARKLVKAVDSFERPWGKVTSEGDGVSTSIVFELGTPLPTGSDGKTITGLEFLAETLGDIEDVLYLDHSFDQALALIKHVARPINIDIPLQSLPSWAVALITQSDGLAIAQQVLPSFLE